MNQEKMNNELNGCKKLIDTFIENYDCNVTDAETYSFYYQILSKVVYTINDIHNDMRDNLGKAWTQHNVNTKVKLEKIMNE